MNLEQIRIDFVPEHDRLLMRLASGDPGRTIIMRGLRPLCHRRCRAFWLAHYRMDSSTPQSRTAFLTKVEAKAASL